MPSSKVQLSKPQVAGQEADAIASALRASVPAVAALLLPDDRRRRKLLAGAACPHLPHTCVSHPSAAVRPPHTRPDELMRKPAPPRPVSSCTFRRRGVPYHPQCRLTQSPRTTVAASAPRCDPPCLRVSRDPTGYGRFQLPSARWRIALVGAFCQLTVYDFWGAPCCRRPVLLGAAGLATKEASARAAGLPEHSVVPGARLTARPQIS